MAIEPPRPAAPSRAVRSVRVSVLLAGTLFAGRTAVELLAQSTRAGELLGPAWTGHLVGVVLAAALGTALAVRELTSARGEPGLAALLGLLCVVGTATAAYEVALLQPFTLLTWSTAMAQGFGLFAVLLVLAPLGSRLPAGLRYYGGRSLVVAALVPPLAEVALRLGGRVLDLPVLDSASIGASARVEHNRYPHKVRWGFPCDSRGHYDHEPPRAAREEPLVVSIGDSFSQGSVPHALHFTTVAEAALGGVEIYNMGLNTIGPGEYLHLLETEALPLEPDLVLVNVFVGNDVGLPGRHAGVRPFLEEWFARDRLLLWLLPQRLARLSAARREAGGEVGIQPGQDAIAGVADLSLEELHRKLPWLADPLAEVSVFPPAAFLDIERKRIETICRPRSHYGALFDAIEDMLAAAGETPIAFVVIPDEFQVEEEVWAAATAELDVEVDRFLPQRRLAEWFDARDVAALDLLPHLREVEVGSDGKRHLYHLRDTHFNARGNAVAGRAIATLVERLLLDASGSR